MNKECEHEHTSLPILLKADDEPIVLECAHCGKIMGGIGKLIFTESKDDEVKEKQIILHIEHYKGTAQILENKEFPTDNYWEALGLAIRYCNDLGSDLIDLRQIHDPV